MLLSPTRAKLALEQRWPRGVCVASTEPGHSADPGPHPGSCSSGLEAAQASPTIQNATRQNTLRRLGPSRLWALFRGHGGLPLHQTVNYETECCWWPRTTSGNLSHCLSLVPGLQKDERVIENKEVALRMPLPWGPRVFARSGTQDTLCRGRVGCFCTTKEVTL